MLKSIVAAALLTMSAGAAIAADYSIIPQPQRVAPRRAAVDVCHVERCGPRGCRVVNLCRCPDRYACYGLYDAYRPYGGTAFLSVYTEY
ncbi:hypothetical protein [Bradyrhizobium sp. USDA 3240]